MPLIPCDDLSGAGWIMGSDLPWGRLVTFGPEGFLTYARLRFLPDPTSPGEKEPSLGVDGPVEYRLLRIAVSVLREHTHTTDDAYFCMWDGWGTAPVLHGLPRVAVQERSFFLFRGALSDFDDWNSPRMAGIPAGFAVPPPAFIWPADHAWCVSLDVDSHYAGIGATPEAIAQLIAHRSLDVILANPAEQQPNYE